MSTLEVVIPVHNEQVQLAACVRRVHAFLRELSSSYRIVVVDNASTDHTWAIAQGLVEEFEDVAAVRLAEKGRGRAIKAAWTASYAEVLCYMDVDLSTDLRAFLPLITPLLSDQADVAIGSRLHFESTVRRGPKRELLSRGYNRLLRWRLGARFSDAQCGFKAIRREAAQRLLPRVEDDGWFFDTELLVLAQRAGMRIHEVPVIWTDDPDSRVDIVSTVLEDLRGIRRLRRTDPPASSWAESLAR
ncbi:glycosyltransferase family 2 protein [Nocardioides sp. BP30]|uniref:dolichyl-phosphate beta-glucosyltransferase n=1 Tax=Nocardioides sp. BP30 TaxID=3036374 RepID=UPI00246976E3|nr:glycosyltransferase family 2 protein [Nocardioides sp. BP30]WGL51745.1 glycosyltransferase family 2 protein [Nocardioides sp. BP30]